MLTECSSASDFMDEAVKAIDEKFGCGFARRNPSLIAAHMHAAGLVSISSSLFELKDSLRSDHPLQGQTFSGLESALQSIADSIANREF